MLGDDNLIQFRSKRWKDILTLDFDIRAILDPALPFLNLVLIPQPLDGF